MLEADSKRNPDEEELMEQYVAHKSMLNSVTNKVNLEEEFQLISTPSDCNIALGATA